MNYLRKNRLKFLERGCLCKKKKKEESCWWKETLDTIITAVGLATITWVVVQGREEAKKEALRDGMTMLDLMTK